MFSKFFCIPVFIRQTSPLILLCLLSACAAQLAQKEGNELIATGKIEAGLKKLEEATQLEPGSGGYRANYLRAKENAINQYLQNADHLAASSKMKEAEKIYQEILHIAPDNDRAIAALHMLAAHTRHSQWLKDAELATQKKDTELALHKLRSILLENPQHAQALAMQDKIRGGKNLPVFESQLSANYKKPINIEFKDVSLKQLFEVLAKTSGLNFIFDKDIKLDQKTSIYLKNSNIQTALHFTLLTNQLEQQVLNDNSVLIYPNTVAKQKDYQEMVVKTFFLSNADAKSVANTIKAIVKSKDIVVDEKLNMLIVRDNQEAIKLTEKLVALQDVAEPEVMLEVEILEVKRSRLLELGIKWPDSLNLTPLPGVTGGTLTLQNLKSNINPATLGATVSPLIINARKQDSDANILANPRIRARNHEKAKILIGERVPNITTTSTATGFVSESINYLDVGLKLEVEPTIYLDSDVAIKIFLEVSNIVGQQQTKSGTSAYQIGTRTASTVLRLKDGETQILAGLINDEDRSNANKVPGIGEIPVLGRLFGSTSDNGFKTEIVLSITPRLVRNIIRPEAHLAEFRAGTDSSLRNRPDGGQTTSVNVTNTTINQTSSEKPLPINNNNQANNLNNGTSQGTVPYNQSNNSGGLGSGGIVNVPAAQLLWQGPTQIKVGDSFTLQLSMQSEQAVFSLPLAVGFDPAALQVVSVTEGAFLKQGGIQTNFNSRVDPSGQITVNVNRNSDIGATQAGSVMSINFKALANSPASRIQLLTITPTGLQGRPISAPLPFPHTVKIE
jgi:general secretion pathway protein D